MSIITVLMHLVQKPENHISVSLEYAVVGNGRIGLDENCHVNVLKPDRSEHPLDRVAWESVVLSGIFWALRTAGKHPKEFNGQDIVVSSIIGVLDEMESTGVAVATGIALLNQLKIAVPSSDLQGWEVVRLSNNHRLGYEILEKEVVPTKTLLIDDVRTMNVDRIERTYAGGIKALAEEYWDILYLDHDFGTSETDKDGHEIACWLENNPENCPKKIFLITANPIGRERIVDVLLRIGFVRIGPCEYELCSGTGGGNESKSGERPEK